MVNPVLYAAIPMMSETFFDMPIQSKYSNAEVETLITELLNVLEKHQAPTDLSLMALGNTVSYLLTTKVSKESREALAEQFAKALTQSLR